jgi:hypothetical protein
LLSKEKITGEPLKCRELPNPRISLSGKTINMKKILFASMMLLAVAVQAQDKEKVQAAKGVVFGVVSEEGKPVTADELKDKLVDNQYQGLIRAKVG